MIDWKIEIWMANSDQNFEIEKFSEFTLGISFELGVRINLYSSLSQRKIDEFEKQDFYTGVPRLTCESQNPFWPIYFWPPVTMFFVLRMNKSFAP